LATFFSLTVKAHVHSVTHGHLQTSSVPSIKRIRHSRSSLLVPAEIQKDQNGVSS